MKKKFFFLWSFFFVFFIFPDGFYVASYNVQNLFDDVEDGTEYQEFLPSSGWSANLVRRNMASVSSVLRRLDADVVLLQEVENQRTIEMLRDEFLSDMGYVEAFCPYSDSATSVGVLSRFPFSYVRVHAFYNEDFPYLRPVVEFSFSYGGEDFFVFVVHLKSKRGGDKKTAAAREFQLALVARRVDEIMRCCPGNVIIAGDFNERDDVVDSFIDLFTGYDFLSGWELFSAEGGSYFFNNRWERIDSFFFSPLLADGRGFDVVSMSRLSEGLLTDGRPVRRDYSTGKGFSDHLPIVMCISGILRDMVPP